MTPRLVVLAPALLVFLGLLAFLSDPDGSDALTQAERERAANAPGVVIESETAVDETVRPSTATETPEVTFQVEPGGATAPPGEDGSLLTVEGYDPQRVRYLLQESDLPVEIRQDYLSRLETAFEDREKLAAVLAALRAELAPG